MKIMILNLAENIRTIGSARGLATYTIEINSKTVKIVTRKTMAIV